MNIIYTFVYKFTWAPLFIVDLKSYSGDISGFAISNYSLIKFMMMKKFYLLIVLLTTSLLASGQLFLNEDFSAGQMPPEGWTISAFANNWSAESSTNAGGQAPEARFSWTPQFNGQSYLISPSMDLSSNNSGTLLISFRHMIDHYGGPYSVGMAVRSNGGAWNTVWQLVNPSSNVSAQQVSVELDSDMVSSSDFQLAMFFSGNSFNINFWYIDEIEVLAPQEFDLALSSLDIPDMIGGPTIVAGSVTNLGVESINSFDLNWRLGSGAINTTSFTGLDLGFGEHFSFESDQLLDAEPGLYELTVFISNMNGQSSDDNTENNFMSKMISVAHGEAVRRPLFEMFTSSTCPPCATFNNGFFNNFTDNNADDITLIKYQMNWPGAGDPYYTPEGGVRRTYYGVGGVPALFLEGNTIATNGTAVTNGLQQALQVPAFVEINGYYQTEGTQIDIQGSLLPYADYNQARLHVVVIESVTYGNAGTNGETFFKHVMHKMLPNAQGTVVSLNANEPYTFNHSFNMASTNVEEMDDLMVVVFLQNHTTREIYQSAYMQYGSMPDIFNVEFEVIDSNENPYHNATITMDGTENEPGDYLFPDMTPGTYQFVVSTACKGNVEGEVTVSNNHVLHTVILQDAVTGDANGDGQVNVLDIISMANFFAGHDVPGFCFENADINQDGVINSLDLIITISIFAN